MTTVIHRKVNYELALRRCDFFAPLRETIQL